MLLKEEDLDMVCEKKMGSREDEQEEYRKDACALGLGLGFQKKSAVVGYALTSKKTKSFLQPKLEGLARNKGIIFVAIDQNRPLSEQGPFDIVLHKLTGREWRQILERAYLLFPPS